MSIASRKSRIPPAILKADIPIPSVSSSRSPINKNINKIVVASSIPRNAIFRR
jgi:hypothetical protein